MPEPELACLHPLTDFLTDTAWGREWPNSTDIAQAIQAEPTYYYEGDCPRTGTLLRLPRTALAESVACRLMQQLAAQNHCNEGKMYGVLLVVDSFNQYYVLQAFSGLLNGKAVLSSWVPPITGRDQVALVEAQTLATLNQIKQELITLQFMPERKQYDDLAQEFEDQRQQLNLVHQERKQERQQKRQFLLETLVGDKLAIALEALNDQSRRDGIERRRFKQQRDSRLQPLKQVIEQTETRIRYLKHRRRALSRQLQHQLHAAYRLTNFAGETLALEAFQQGMPTGTGECCAPKLLHYAATHQLKPLAMAEFWWGPASQDKVAGEFYPACAERCQPLMGFLLSGLSPDPNIPQFSQALPILYQDEWLIAVDKPAGLLSVPGRYGDRQDSVWSRLQQSIQHQSNGAAIQAVHRLDQETSGILLLARDTQTQRQLSQQFQQRTVRKVYEALLAGRVTKQAGVIDLPLWGDPADRPRQQVNWQHGKPSQTQFRVLSSHENLTRVEFIPITGRTHQLRVHAAEGLGFPIWGDRLYGCALPTHPLSADRLHLHARELQVYHPQSGQLIQLYSPTPF